MPSNVAYWRESLMGCPQFWYVFFSHYTCNRAYSMSRYYLFNTGI
jgi:hypothetical protein